MRLAQPDIILDCDGVILDFLAGFVDYAARLGMAAATPQAECRDYDFGDLYPSASSERLRDLFASYVRDDSFAAVPFVPGARRALASLRASFPTARIVVVTSCGVYPETRAARLSNLRSAQIDEVFFLPMGGAKGEVLGRFAPALYVDDQQRHVDEAVAAGHDAYLFRRSYNAASPYPRAFGDWEAARDAMALALDERLALPRDRAFA